MDAALMTSIVAGFIGFGLLLLGSLEDEEDMIVAGILVLIFDGIVGFGFICGGIGKKRKNRIRPPQRGL